MSEQDTTGKTTAPATPPAAKVPTAVDNLRALENEAKGDDVQLAGEIRQAETAEASALLNEQEKQKAAATGAMMAVGMAETFLSMGLGLAKIDDDTVTGVKKVIDLHRAPLIDALAPVLAKNNMQPPPAIAALMPEIRLGFRLLMMIVGVFVALRDGRAKAKAKAEERKPAPADGELQAAA